MPQFQPFANDDFSLNINARERRFRAVEHPNAVGIAHAMEGAKAIVYRIRNLDKPTDYYALKVMKAKHREAAVERICNQLDSLKNMSGLVICERRCLSPNVAFETIKTHPNLEYAILMPWVQGQSWFDVLYLGKKQKSIFSKSQSFKLASSLLGILYGLEKAGIAHCDLSAGNIILDPGRLKVELLDVEEMFAPNFKEPSYIPTGTPGYQHQKNRIGLWHAKADRFAGAILLGEMLGWYDSNVRISSYGESYFAPDELQSKECTRLMILAEAISNHHPDLALLFKAAWEAPTLGDCPSFSEWWSAFRRIQGGPTSEILTNQSSIGMNGTPFWVGFSGSLPKLSPEEHEHPDNSEFKSTVTQDVTPVRWDNSPLDIPKQPANEPPIRWIGSLIDDQDEK